MVYDYLYVTTQDFGWESEIEAPVGSEPEAPVWIACQKISRQVLPVTQVIESQPKKKDIPS